MAGLLRENSLYPFMYRGQVNDLNNATKAGFYLASQNAANSPTYYPMVFVFEISNLYVQIAKELTANGNLYVRTNSGATWKSWDKVTTTVV